MRNINFLEESLPRHIMNKIPLLKVKVYVRYLTRIALVSVRCSSVLSKRLEKKVLHIVEKYARKHGIYFGYSGYNEYKVKLSILFGYGALITSDSFNNLSKVPVEIKANEFTVKKPLRLLNSLIDVLDLELEIPQLFTEHTEKETI